MPAATNAALPPLPAFTAAQRNLLLSAKAWWQEGDRALDYLAERERRQTLLSGIRSHVEALRHESSPNGDHLVPLFRLARQVTGNRALNRTLATPEFAAALRTLLFGEESLSARLAAFLSQPAVGATTASHLLYVAFPDRYPLVSPQTKSVLAASRQQMGAARAHATALYGLSDETPNAVRDLLTEITLYESILRLLGLTDYTELNGILWHAREIPSPSSRRRAAGRVRETGGNYVVPSIESTAPPSEPALVAYDESDLLVLIESEIRARGFTFPPLMVRNYYIALKAKPFVILTGLSGTGKTRLTRLLADALTGGSPDQYLLIAVRPDWHDSTGLLGYHNLLADRYIGTPFLDTLYRAAQSENRERAFFATLDEMNLARVEHYFAEVLSAMETEEGRILLPEGRTALLPANVFLTGSVNMDEATHPFSRKVLDRANTLEFTEVTLRATDAPPAAPLPEIPPPERQRLFLSARVSTLAAAQERLAAVNSTYADHVLSTLSALNALLTPRSLHFGYRVRDEVLRYIAAAFTPEGKGLLDEEPNTNLRIALDLQIVQKVLPRLTGTTETLGRLLREIEEWATGQALPRTASKLTRMRQRAAEEGFVTFYEL